MKKYILHYCIVYHGYGPDGFENYSEEFTSKKALKKRLADLRKAVVGAYYEINNIEEVNYASN